VNGTRRRSSCVKNRRFDLRFPTAAVASVLLCVREPPLLVSCSLLLPCAVFLSSAVVGLSNTTSSHPLSRPDPGQSKTHGAEMCTGQAGERVQCLCPLQSQTRHQLRPIDMEAVMMPAVDAVSGMKAEMEQTPASSVDVMRSFKIAGRHMSYERKTLRVSE
jgi:hypothetical protein